ncbi:stage V sporulation protein AE [Alicyclobacillus ferrooxydans]|uniref:Stage V sporulation protein AE n=1 Tax=Alicyclobacillus ferrooxydans TaxID=471514 RepID=A0A0P9CD37_9BACL|nr:stage V sporulation protein AE [Alicyclobacillus ferrooxydans]KPV43527.1 stage V sporulation protein AE [Alicyclobacillus ferrooxydans]
MENVHRKKRVILVTDGDTFARRALEIAAKQLKMRVISRTAGNPTRLSGTEIVHFVKQAAYDPVLVMFDDNGDGNQAGGEQALHVICNHPDIEVMGALAVASNTSLVKGVGIDFSIDADGHTVSTGVDKDGHPIHRYMVFGDTVDALRDLNLPVIIGIGDLGKMSGSDSPERAAPVTTAALRQLMEAYEARTRQGAHSNH